MATPDQLLGQFVLLLPPDVVGDHTIGALGGPDTPLAFYLLDSSSGCIDHLPGLVLLSSEVSDQIDPDVLNQIGGQLYSVSPVGYHHLFKFLNLQIGQVAAVAAMPAKAEEIGVGAAVALELADRQAGLATAAEHAALEVMVVADQPFARLVVGGQDGLNLVEYVRGDQRNVLAVGILHTAIGHDAQVVGVGQHGVEPGQVERSFGLAATGSVGQTFGCEVSQQAKQGVVAGGVGLEGPGDERCSFGVKVDGAELPALIELTDVEVADRSLVGCTAVLGLLDAAFQDLCRQVLAVELGDRGHDAVQQSPRWGLVNVLGDGHQLDPGGFERQPYGDVIGSVSGQAVDLVDDDVVDVPLGLDPVQHPLQGRAGRGLGALPGVYELLHHGGIE